MSFFKVYIPARYASVRLPGKPLLDIGGRPLIWHVYERARAAGAGDVVIATDDARIRDAAVAFGAAVVMTSVAHRSGTERIAEACALNGEPDDLIVVNLQGDEPEMPAPLIREVAQLLADTPEAEMATLCAKIERPEELFDPNVVKVVVDEQGDALYFSRAPIPWARDLFAPATPTKSLPDAASWLRHIGLYAYRVGFLRRFSRLRPSPPEAIEQLEQLRALHHGARIRVGLASVLPPIGIDTPDDLERARMAQLTSTPG